MLLGRSVLIVGAGIGGLAAAVALARRGAAVTLLERSPAITEVGAGLQISPNGAAVLDALGLGPELAAIGMPAESVTLRRHRDASEITRLDIAAARFARPWMLVHRADLIGLLARAAAEAGVDIRLNAPVAAVDPESRGDVILEDGTLLHAEVIVAADGVRSGLRAALDGAGQPEFRGQVAWRAVVPVAVPRPARVDLVLGPGSHLVRYPLRQGRLVNIVAVEERRDWVEEGWSHPGDPERLRAIFAGYAPELRADLEQVRDVHVWGLHRRPVARLWHRGRVALLGDAAHATLPFLAQGACLALEDAWVLAQALGGTDSVEAGLTLYQQLRQARAERTVAAADFNARAYHLALPGLRQAAHLCLSLAGRLRPGAALAKFDWLYRTDVTQG